jgi:hypothetical protein
MGWFPIGYVRLMNDRKSNLNKSNLIRGALKDKDISGGTSYIHPICMIIINNY